MVWYERLTILNLSGLTNADFLIVKMFQWEKRTSLVWKM